jgi:autotransporter translocation and assembly factor TamB
MIRLAGWLLSALLLSALTAAALVTWLLASDPGSRYLATLVQDQFPELQLEGVSGNFVNGITIQHLVYEDTRKIQLTDVYADILLWPLIELEALEFLELRIAELEVEDNSTRPTSPLTDPLGSLNLPAMQLPIVVQDLSVGNFVMSDVKILNIQAKASWNENGIMADSLSLAVNDVELNGNLTLPSGANPSIRTQSQWFYESYQGKFSVAGPSNQLQVGHLLSSNNQTIVESTGTVNLHDFPRISAALQHNLVDPAASLHTKIAGDIESGLKKWTVDAAGTVVQYQVTGTGVVDLNATPTITVNQAIIDGHTHLSGLLLIADGAPAFDGVAAIPDLARIQSALTGSLSAGLTWKEGHVIALISSREIGVRQYSFGSLEAKITGELEDLAFDVAWDTGRLSGAVTNATTNPEISIDPNANLQFENFSLTNTQGFRVSRQNGLWRASPHCWQGLGELCVESNEFSQDISTIAGSISNLLLAALPNPAAVKFAPNAKLSGTWEISTTGTQWQAQMDLQTQDLALEIDAKKHTWVPDITVSATISSAGAALTAQGQNEMLDFQSELDIQGLGSDATLAGELNFTAEAAIAKQFIDPITAINGKTNGTLNLAGTITEPVFTTTGQWHDGDIKWLSPAIDLKQINAQWFADNHRWTIQGEAQPKDGGLLNITGQGDGYSPQAQISAAITGKGLSLKSKNWTVIAAPDVQLKASQGNVTFSGSTDIPEALIELKTLPKNLPKPAADVRVVGRPELPRGTENGKLEGELTVNLGDDVVLELLALKVRLTGTLQATVKSNEVTQLYGELSVADGSLNASGQSLRVREGKILFSGNPTTPYVDLIAVRTIPEQTPPLEVGLRISGRSDNLTTAVYSDPAMSETRTLSFLVLGRDFNEASETDNQQLMTAAIGFGLSQTQGVVQQLRGILGLDELSALAAEQNDFAIIAGKRINDNLYVRYSYNALSAVGALIIRYYLTDRWRLEATNDVNSSMDLLYELKR